MNIEFEKITDKDDFIIIIIPTIAFGKDSGNWFIGFGWLCFSIDVSF